VDSKRWEESKNLIHNLIFILFGLGGSNIGVHALFEIFQLGILSGVELDTAGNSSTRLGQK
jgi:hypothetical protein